MKKYIISAVVIICILAYAIINGKSMEGVNTSTSSSSNNQTASNSLRLKDGEYTGTVSDAFYGNVQVKATINGGKLTNVEFLQYPNDRQESLEINSRAIPLLQQEAIQAQASQVDIISGATDTSEAFIQSLSTALQQSQG